VLQIVRGQGVLQLPNAHPFADGLRLVVLLFQKLLFVHHRVRAQHAFRYQAEQPGAHGHFQAVGEGARAEDEKNPGAAHCQEAYLESESVQPANAEQAVVVAKGDQSVNQPGEHHVRVGAQQLQLPPGLQALGNELVEAPGNPEQSEGQND